MTEVRSRVALTVVLNRNSVVCGQEVFPLFVPVGIRNSVLGLDVTVIIVSHGVFDNTVYGFGKQLTEFVVGIFGYTVNAVCNLGYSFLGIIFIRYCSAAGECYLTYKLRCRAGFQFLAGSVLFGKLSRKITELS